MKLTREQIAYRIDCYLQAMDFVDAYNTETVMVDGKEYYISGQPMGFAKEREMVRRDIERCLKRFEDRHL